MGRHAALRPSGEDRYTRGDQEIFEQIEVGGGRLAVHADIARDLGHIDERSLRKAGAFQKPAECREVPGASFLKDLLAKIAFDIRRQISLGIRLGVHGGELAVDQRPLN